MLNPANYERTIPFTGDREAAMRLAMNALVANGFRLADKSEHELSFLGPGLNSSRENPVRGATAVRLTWSCGSLSLDAELGGVRRMARFLIFFPLAMAAFFLLLGGLLLSFGLRSGANPAMFAGLAVPALALSPWLFLSPWMIRRIRARTVLALDDLLGSLALASRSEQA